MKEKKQKMLLIAVKEEMRFLGIDQSCRGVKAIFEVLTEKKNFDDLTPKEHTEIVDAWDSRHFTPASLYRRFKPVVKTEECSSKDLETYYKNVSRNVLLFFSQPVAA